MNENEKRLDREYQETAYAAEKINYGEAVKLTPIPRYIDDKIGALEREVKFLEEMKKTYLLLPTALQKVFEPAMMFYLTRDQKR